MTITIISGWNLIPNRIRVYGLFLLIGIFALGFSGNAQSQALSNLKVKSLLPADTIQLDSLSIIPSSFSLTTTSGQTVNTKSYQLDWLRSKLIWLSDERDSLKITYRTFPYAFGTPQFNKDIRLKRAGEEGILIDPFRYEVSTTADDFFDFGDLQYSGSFSRDLSIGNNQDVILNSNFNLQMSGMLTEDLKVTAAITDNNIPIQPEGNTQQLQEFDKIFIRLQRQGHQVTLGDFDLRHQNGQFLRYKKRLQGIDYRGKVELNEEAELQLDGTIAVAKGKFAVNNLAVKEGNQGPYKLIGNNGEQFIIVLAGSERIFIDGQLLKRGANNDYIIDYNLGEITFTTNRLITANLRIRAEFEYSERSYFRTGLAAGTAYSSKGFTTGIRFYQESDNKNQPLDETFTESQTQALQQAGDNLDNLLFKSLRNFDGNNNLVTYELVDSLHEGTTYDSVLVFSSNTEVQRYTATFSNVGSGNGDYVLASTGVNGRVYQWVAPIAGVSQGSFEPVIKLVAPNRKQMTTGYAGYSSENGHSIYSEVAMSNTDLNTFSSLNSGDNVGMAAHASYGFNKVLSEKRSLKTEIDYNFQNRNFNPIERYRSNDFSYDWNLTNQESKVDEHLTGLFLGYQNERRLDIRYWAKMLNRSENYLGFQQTLNFRYQQSGWEVSSRSKQLNANADVSNTKSSFSRPQLTISKTWGKGLQWKTGASADAEINSIREITTDTLTDLSFIKRNTKVFIEIGDSMARTTIGASAAMYAEHRPGSNNQFDPAFFEGRTFDFYGKTDGKHQNLQWNLIYRNVNTSDSSRLNNNLKNYYLGKITYNVTGLAGFIRWNSYYEVGAGQEQKITYDYVPVTDGSGTYIYRDLNENGVRELNEYLISQFQEDTMYVRFITTTNEFQPVNKTSFNNSISLSPSAIWKQKTGFLQFLTRFNNRTSFQLTKKTFLDPDADVITSLSPISGEENDILTISNTFRNNLTFNRGSRWLTVDYGYLSNRNRTLLLSGIDERTSISNSIKTRSTFLRAISLELSYRNQLKTNRSEFFTDRNYDLLEQLFGSRLAFTASGKMRIALLYDYAFKTNPHFETGGQFAVNNQIGLDTKVTLGRKGSITGKFSYALVGYEEGSKPNSQVEFAMLQGLEDGQNFIWGLTFERLLSKAFQLSILYDGRKTGKADQAIHTGRAQIRAIF